ncbi:MAG: hypothetical protein J6V53_01520 [Alphaproteobacteria bacterium]|nr:hypothetical protein [Alphaproteobacteria bacterium]
MTEKTYLEKTNRLDTLLKSQNVYDYMLDLMGIRVKNMLPKEESIRKKYDTARLNASTEKSYNHLLAQEKNELTDLLKNNRLVKHYALLKVTTDYGTHACIKDLDENLKKLDMPKPYSSLISHNKIKIPADKIRVLVYC